VNDSDRLMKLALAAGRVIEAHNKAAAEMESGFICGCKTVCGPLIAALEAVGLMDRKKIVAYHKVER
jgi:hypothetical protein